MYPRGRLGRVRLCTHLDFCSYHFGSRPVTDATRRLNPAIWLLPSPSDTLDASGSLGRVLVGRSFFLSPAIARQTRTPLCSCCRHLSSACSLGSSDLYSHLLSFIEQRYRYCSFTNSRRENVSSPWLWQQRHAEWSERCSSFRSVTCFSVLPQKILYCDLPQSVPKATVDLRCH